MFNILLVDDERIERDALSFIIKKNSLPILEIFEAENGVDALTICSESKVDIIILDINMPGISGLQMLEMLRAKENHAKVIISTAYSQFEYAVKALQFGATDFLVKPLSEELLLTSLKKTIERLQEEQQKEINISKMSEYLKIRESKLNLDSVSENNKTVKKICSYIKSNYAKHIGLEEIASDCGYSKFYINKLFKSEMETTVVDYLIHYRMEKAKELLELSRESVKLIAFRVGYSDPNYFIWTFKKMVGFSPLQFRAQAVARQKQK